MTQGPNVTFEGDWVKKLLQNGTGQHLKSLSHHEPPRTPPHRPPDCTQPLKDMWRGSGEAGTPILRDLAAPVPPARDVECSEMNPEGSEGLPKRQGYWRGPQGEPALHPRHPTSQRPLPGTQLGHSQSGSHWAESHHSGAPVRQPQRGPVTETRRTDGNVREGPEHCSCSPALPSLSPDTSLLLMLSRDLPEEKPPLGVRPTETQYKQSALALLRAAPIHAITHAWHHPARESLTLYSGPVPVGIRA